VRSVKTGSYKKNIGALFAHLRKLDNRLWLLGNQGKEEEKKKE